jgi:uncharacterized protein affecting Mg2+/Co2+ transport
MSTPEMSDITTHGVRVGASAFYLPAESEPDQRKFIFGYNIVIVNGGDAAAKLVSRHWLIIDANGKEEHVRGPGVVGQTPRLEPARHSSTRASARSRPPGARWKAPTSSSATTGRRSRSASGASTFRCRRKPP